MKFAAFVSALFLLSTQTAFATISMAPIAGKVPVKASLYEVKLVKQSDNFYTAVRSPICTIRFEADIWDLRSNDMAGINPSVSSCDATVDGVEMHLNVGAIVTLATEQIHNDEGPTVSKTYTGVLNFQNKSQSTAPYPKTPDGMVQTRNINSKDSIIVHLGASSTVTCDDKETSSQSDCHIDNPVENRRRYRV